jgi:hypothetical protein
LTDEYGSQTAAVRTLIAQARKLTGDEFTRLADSRTAARDAVGDATRNAAWDTARNAARDTPREAAWYTAGAAARYAVWAASQNVFWNTTQDVIGPAAQDVIRLTTRSAGIAVVDAALALAVRDLIPDDVYRTLTGPWAEAIGPAHPDDPVETPHD